MSGKQKGVRLLNDGEFSISLLGQWRQRHTRTTLYLIFYELLHGDVALLPDVHCYGGLEPPITWIELTPPRRTGISSWRL